MLATLSSASDTLSSVSPWHKKLTVCILGTQSTQLWTVNGNKHSCTQVKRGMCSKAPFSGLWEGMCSAVLPHGAGMRHLCEVLGFIYHCPHWAAGALGDRHCVPELGTLKDLSSVI